MTGSNLVLSSERTKRASARPQRSERLLLLGAYSYPVLVVVSFYLTWFVAWAVLGHMPRPNLDDPKYIGLLVDIPYCVCTLLLMGVPGVMPLSALMAPIALARQAAPGARLARGLIALSALILLWAAALWFLHADPWDVVTWYFD